MRVLGVDPGSKLCGYAVIDVKANRCCVYLECGVLSPGRGDRAECRLGAIACWLTDVINEFRPTVVALEDVFIGVNPRSALALAQARGTVLAVAGLSGLSVYSYAPRLVKQSVTGGGGASKGQVAKMAASLLGLRTPPQADAADALAIAITHSMRFEMPQLVTNTGTRRVGARL